MHPSEPLVQARGMAAAALCLSDSVLESTRARLHTRRVTRRRLSALRLSGGSPDSRSGDVTEAYVRSEAALASPLSDKRKHYSICFARRVADGDASAGEHTLDAHPPSRQALSIDL